MIRSTFRIAPGVGRWQEARLWESGIQTWDDFPAAPAGALGAALDARVREAVARARVALDAGDAEALATMLPRSERWRLYAAFARGAVRPLAGDGP